MKYCIVTPLFNNYDKIREPIEVDSNCDYLFFTDNKELKSYQWKVIYLPEFDTNELTGIQKTYIFKYTFYKYIDNIQEYDYLIQLDASIQIYKSLYPIVNYLYKYKYDLSIAPHPYRNNFIDEYNTWMEYRNLDNKYLDMFINNIKDYDFNIAGLCECTMKIYKNCKEVYNFIDDIHNILTYTNNNEDANDQCYFTYILNKHIDKLRINYHTPNLYSYSDYMKIYWHNTNYTWYNGPLQYNKYMKFLNKIIKITDNEEY